MHTIAQRQQQRMLVAENNGLRDLAAEQGIVLMNEALDLSFKGYTVIPIMQGLRKTGDRAVVICRPEEATAWRVFGQNEEGGLVSIGDSKDRTIADKFCKICGDKLKLVLDSATQELMTQEVDITLTLKFEVDCRLDKSDIEQEAIAGITEVLGYLNSDVLQAIGDYVSVISIKEEAEIYSNEIIDHGNEDEVNMKSIRRR